MMGSTWRIWRQWHAEALRRNGGITVGSDSHTELDTLQGLANRSEGGLNTLPRLGERRTTSLLAWPGNTRVSQRLLVRWIFKRDLIAGGALL
jgi:hypothetical protein